MRICFVTDFDEKVTQSVAQIIKYHMSKDFLSLHFAVGQRLSVSGYDLENGRMPWKNVELKTWW